MLCWLSYMPGLAWTGLGWAGEFGGSFRLSVLLGFGIGILMLMLAILM